MPETPDLETLAKQAEEFAAHLRSLANAQKRNAPTVLGRPAVPDVSAQQPTIAARARTASSIPGGYL